jgi:hypothetical protein
MLSENDIRVGLPVIERFMNMEFKKYFNRLYEKKNLARPDYTKDWNDLHRVIMKIHMHTNAQVTIFHDACRLQSESDDFPAILIERRETFECVFLAISRFFNKYYVWPDLPNIPVIDTPQQRPVLEATLKNPNHINILEIETKFKTLVDATGNEELQTMYTRLRQVTDDFQASLITNVPQILKP